MPTRSTDLLVGKSPTRNSAFHVRGNKSKKFESVYTEVSVEHTLFSNKKSVTTCSLGQYPGVFHALLIESRYCCTSGAFPAAWRSIVAASEVLAGVATQYFWNAHVGSEA